MSTLTVALNPGQSAFLDQAPPRDGEVVLTWSFEAALALEARGADFLEVWPLLPDEVLDRTMAEVLEVRESWWRPALEGLVHRGVDLAEAMGRDMLYVFLEAANARAVVEAALDRVRPDRLAIVPGDGRPVFWDPPGGPFPDVFNAVAAWAARSRGLPVDVLPGPEPWRPPFAGVERVFPGPPASWTLGGADLMVYLSNSDYLKQRGVVAAAMERDPSGTLLLKSGSFDAPEARDRWLEWVPLLTRFGPDPGVERAVERAGRALEGLDTAFVRAHPEVFANPALGFQSQAYLERLVLAGRITDAALWLLDRVRPRACLFGSAATGPWRCFARACRVAGTATVGVTHCPVIPDSHMYALWPHDFDVLCVEGDYSRRHFLDQGRDGDAVLVTGNLYPPVERPAVRRDGPPTVLVATTRAGCGLAAPNARHDLLRRDWRAMRELMARRTDLRFVIKPHPRYDYWEHYSLVAHGLDNVALADRDEPFHVSLGRADAVVAFNTCSTVSLEGALAGLPGVYHRSAIFEAGSVRSVLDEHMPMARDMAGLEAFLDDVAAGGEALSANRAAMESFLQDFVDTGDPEATARRVLKVLDRSGRAGAGRADTALARAGAPKASGGVRP